MTCSQQLWAAGKPAPRTCADCGLGPCRLKSDQSPAVPVVAEPAPAAAPTDDARSALRRLVDAVEHEAACQRAYDNAQQKLPDSNLEAQALMRAGAALTRALAKARAVLAMKGAA